MKLEIEEKFRLIKEKKKKANKNWSRNQSTEKSKRVEKIK